MKTNIDTRMIMTVTPFQAGKARHANIKGKGKKLFSHMREYFYHLLEKNFK